MALDRNSPLSYHENTSQAQSCKKKRYALFPAQSGGECIGATAFGKERSRNGQLETRNLLQAVENVTSGIDLRDGLIPSLSFMPICISTLT